MFPSLDCPGRYFPAQVQREVVSVDNLGLDVEDNCANAAGRITIGVPANLRLELGSRRFHDRLSVQWQRQRTV